MLLLLTIPYRVNIVKISPACLAEAHKVGNQFKMLAGWILENCRYDLCHPYGDGVRGNGACIKLNFRTETGSSMKLLRDFKQAEVRIDVFSIGYFYCRYHFGAIKGWHAKECAWEK